MASDLNAELSKKTAIFGLKVWEVIGIAIALFIVIILSVLSLCLTVSQIPTVSKEIKEFRVEKVDASEFDPREGILLSTHLLCCVFCRWVFS